MLIEVSPLSISNNNASKVQVLLDNNLLSSSDLLAFHPSDVSKTIFITAPEVRDYLTATGVKITNVDFAATSVGGCDSLFKVGLTCSAAVGKPEAKRATTKPGKEDAKIEGAALIGIDVRKDLDFPNWYQQVLTKGEMVSTSVDKTYSSLNTTMSLGVIS